MFGELLELSQGNEIDSMVLPLDAWPLVWILDSRSSICCVEPVDKQSKGSWVHVLQCHYLSRALLH